MGSALFPGTETAPQVAVPGAPALRTLADLLAPHTLHHTAAGGAVASFLGLQLTSVYQAIVSSADGHALGAEAYVRSAGSDGPELSPWNLFAQAGSGEEVVRLDRLCRALHVANFGAGLARGETLFLNVHPDLPEVVKADFGLSFRRILALLGVAPERCVLELRVANQAPTRLLRDVLRGFRARGFQVALDLGLGPTTDAPFALDGLGEMPDYLKFTPTAELDLARRALQRARAAGVQLIGTRLGDAASLALARSLGADYLQGHAIARATIEPAHSSTS